MSEAKMQAHTPGPWECYADLPSTDPSWHIVTSAGRTRVVANVHIEPGNATDEANASLISAAPDLLAACKACLDNCGCQEDNDPCANCARLEAAIAKAEGGKS